MLRELHILNLAVIADARIELSAGLNCFTGATGAGKSLVIGAIEVLLGLRNPAEMLRPGADEGRVTGAFELRNPPLLEAIESLTDVPVSADGGELLITRRLFASGRSSVSLNGHPITLGMLRQVGEQLVDVHGQHDHQYLLKPSNQLEVLDQFGELAELRGQYGELFKEVVQMQQQIEELTANRMLRAQQLELYRFQADEIDQAALEPGEYIELQARASVLQNLEKLKKEAGAVHASLYEMDGSVLERLKMMGAVLAELSVLDQQLAPTARNMRDATIGLEEVAFDLSRYLDKLDLDPGELTEVNDRLNVVNRILSKYGDPIEATLVYRQEIGQKIAALDQQTEDFAAVGHKLAPLLAKLEKAGRQLSAQRQATAKKLARLIEKELAQLGMDKARFTISLTPAAGAIPGQSLPATPSGFDQPEFIVQTNPGLAPQPLRKIASGGELSRIMLALKGILAQSDRISVLVFDEVDANVGGRLGSVIGNKLRNLAGHHQVLCITHLPQIAAYADLHLTVCKDTSGNMTETRVRVMEGVERIAELSEMIGGQRVTDTTRAQAKELLDSAHPDASEPLATRSMSASGKPRNGRSGAKSA